MLPLTSPTVSATFIEASADCCALAVNSSLDAATCSEVVAIFDIKLRKLLLIALNAVVNEPISSFVSTSTSLRRKLPFESSFACASSSITGRVIFPANFKHINTISANPTSVNNPNVKRSLLTASNTYSYGTLMPTIQPLASTVEYTKTDSPLPFIGSSTNSPSPFFNISSK